MSRRLIVATAHLIMLTVALSFAASETAVAQSKPLRFALLQPVGGAEHEMARFFQERSLALGGPPIELMPSRFRAPEAIEGVRSGTVEIGSVLLDDLAPRINAIELFLQPFMFHSATVLDAAMALGSPVRTPLDAAILNQLGLRVLWWQQNGAAITLSNGPAVKAPSDIIGRLVRSPGPALSAMIDSCGGSPVQVPAAEMADAMKSGRAQVALTAMGAVVPRKVWEWADSLTVTRHAAGALVMVVHEATWQSLPIEQQKAILLAGLEADREGLIRSQAHHSRDLDIARQNKMTIYEINPDSVTLWKDCSSGLVDRFVQTSDPLVTDVLKGYRQIVIESYRRPPQ